jgi:MFS transporter, DHA1 family, multidrug resistance protein
MIGSIESRIPQRSIVAIDLLVVLWTAAWLVLGIAALVLVSMLSPFAINVIVPSLPAIQRYFAADYGTVQLALSLFLASVAGAQILLGPLSDRFGRRPVLLAGLGLFTLASLACVLAPSVESLVALRVVQAVGGSAGLVLARAIIRDLYETGKAASMLGYLTMGFAISPMFAPFIGGVLQSTFDWRASFWFMAAFGVLCMAVAWRRIEETNLNPSDRMGLATLFRNFRHLLGMAQFRRYLACAMFASSSFFAFLGGAPYVSEILLGLSPTVYGAWFMLMVVGYVLGNYLSGRHAEQAGLPNMIIIGSAGGFLSLMLIVGLFAAGLEHPAALFLPMILSGVANGVMLPSSLAGAIGADPRIAGAASGLAGAAQMGTGAVFATLAGAAIAGSATAYPLFAVMAIAAAASLAAALAVVRAPT